jgi:hypothetical protein
MKLTRISGRVALVQLVYEEVYTIRVREMFFMFLSFD